jgi:hypothetical protein
MLDRRREQRWPAYLGGKISFSKRFSVADCLVRNTSPRGARLVVYNGCFVPDEFDLSIPCKRVSYRVHARWRRFEVIGVEVAHPPAAEAPVPLAYVRRIKQLEADNKRLKNCLQGP